MAEPARKAVSSESFVLKDSTRNELSLRTSMMDIGKWVKDKSQADTIAAAGNPVNVRNFGGGAVNPNSRIYRDRNGGVDEALGKLMRGQEQPGKTDLLDAALKVFAEHSVFGGLSKALVLDKNGGPKEIFEKISKNDLYSSVAVVNLGKNMLAINAVAPQRDAFTTFASMKPVFEDISDGDNISYLKLGYEAQIEAAINAKVTDLGLTLLGGNIYAKKTRKYEDFEKKGRDKPLGFKKDIEAAEDASITALKQALLSKMEEIKKAKLNVEIVHTSVETLNRVKELMEKETTKLDQVDPQAAQEAAQEAAESQVASASLEREENGTADLLQSKKEDFKVRLQNLLEYSDSKATVFLVNQKDNAVQVLEKTYISQEPKEGLQRIEINKQLQIKGQNFTITAFTDVSKNTSEKEKQEIKENLERLVESITKDSPLLDTLKESSDLKDFFRETVNGLLKNLQDGIDISMECAEEIITAMLTGDIIKNNMIIQRLLSGKLEELNNNLPFKRFTQAINNDLQRVPTTDKGGVVGQVNTLEKRNILRI